MLDRFKLILQTININIVGIKLKVTQTRDCELYQLLEGYIIF